MIKLGRIITYTRNINLYIFELMIIITGGFYLVLQNFFVTIFYTLHNNSFFQLATAKFYYFKIKILNKQRFFMITLEDINKVIEKIKNNNTHECINIMLEENNNLGITDSKFGGIPYIANDSNVPKDSNDIQLSLLAQINCTELPENNLYTKVGLLQFWISRNETLGLNNREDYRVTYIKEIEDGITNEDVLNKYNLLNEDNDEEYSPFNKKNTSFALKFEKGMSSITSNDFQFEEVALQTIQELFPNEDVKDLYDYLERDIFDTLFKAFNGVNHAIGAYPTFTQWDPRNPDEPNVYDITLLQVESQWSNDSNDAQIMWGDSGVANFFINKEKLESLDFEDVLFSWDCF